MVEIHEPIEGFGVAEAMGADASSDSDAAALRTALATHGVLCVRLERPLDDAELQALARCFGPIKDPVARTKDGESLRYSEPRQIIDTGFVMTEEIKEKLGDLQFGGLDDQRPGLFETFHCDDTFTAEPASATVLHARALPPSGGGPTCFIDMRGAYDSLDAATRERIEGLCVRYAHNNEDAFPPRRAARGPGGKASS